MTKEEFGIKLLSYLKSIGWRIRAINVVGVEDFHPDEFKSLPNQWDTFNDSIFVLTDKGEILLNAWCTTESSKYWTNNPMNSKGGARIELGVQFKNSWCIGRHRNQYPALVQCKAITVYRDTNKDGMRSGDMKDTGMFGVNIHTVSNVPGVSAPTVQRWSAGCTVLQNSTTFYNKFMPIVINSGMRTIDYGVIDSAVLGAYLKS